MLLSQIWPPLTILLQITNRPRLLFFPRHHLLQHNIRDHDIYQTGNMSLHSPRQNMNFLYLKTGLMPICDFLINIYIYKMYKKKKTYHREWREEIQIQRKLHLKPLLRNKAQVCFPTIVTHTHTHNQTCTVTHTHTHPYTSTHHHSAVKGSVNAFDTQHFDESHLRVGLTRGQCL